MKHRKEFEELFIADRVLARVANYLVQTGARLNNPLLAWHDQDRFAAYMIVRALHVATIRQFEELSTRTA